MKTTINIIFTSANASFADMIKEHLVEDILQYFHYVLQKTYILFNYFIF